MALEFKMPDIGEGLAEGEVVRWIADVGDEVDLDGPLVEVETDKAVMVIPAPRAGVLLFRGGAEGSVVKVGELLAVIGDRGEEWGAEPGDSFVAPSMLAPDGGSSRPVVGTLEEAASPAAPQSQKGSGSPDLGRPLASPPTRKLAKDLGVDLTGVAGTGPGGRIVRSDVEAQARGTLNASAGEERTPLSGRRRAISEHLSRSWREIPHVTSFESVRAERLMEARSVLSERLGEEVPIEALLIKAILPVLKKMPEFNSSIEGQTVIRHGSFNIGISVDAPEGLMVPVIHDADTKDVAGLSRVIRTLVEGARNRKLEPRDMERLTFTVSNIGSLGGGYGTPIIPYGTAAIISVGRAVKAPVIEAEGLAVGLSMPLSLSYDHRLIDGGTGRRFLAELRKNLEQPLFFLVL